MIWYLTSCVSTHVEDSRPQFYNLQFTVSMLTPGRIIDSESRLVTTLTLIARQRADTGTPRYQGIMAGWREKWISIVSIISIATIPTWLLYHYRSCTHRHEDMFTHDIGLASEDVTLPIQYGARRGSELLMNDQWLSIVSSIYTPATSIKQGGVECAVHCFCFEEKKKLRVKIIVMISISINTSTSE